MVLTSLSRIFFRFSTDLTECNASNYYTQISFSLLGKNDENDEDLTIKLSMTYDSDMERPRQQSLKLTFEPLIDEETMNVVEKQCHLFYRNSLSKALTEVFLEG